MNKKDILQKISNKTNLDYKTVETCVNMFLETISSQVAKNKKVLIAGFGSFDSVIKRERETTHWQTREVYKVPPRRVPKFKASKQFKDLLFDNDNLK
ncbi:HU family DNA-binding protein [Mycoplasma procyoni]|uniref:HU family DNA-binding protein n=1 Tax=Mycoplasma procyoni TaxID=568784 RepID=UPI00197BBF7E|nr:HU family DNA-binding protein [Mycoplasma procyoni]MBN3534422.1 HU family DNA-binding protein [Mycoplasma procyoni]